MSYPKLSDSSDFMTVQNSLWEIKVDHQTPTANWLERKKDQKIICDCPAFLKDFICIHSLGFAVNFLFWDRFCIFWDGFYISWDRFQIFWGKNLYFSGTFFDYSGEKK